MGQNSSSPIVFRKLLVGGVTAAIHAAGLLLLVPSTVDSPAREARWGTPDGDELAAWVLLNAGQSGDPAVRDPSSPPLFIINTAVSTVAIAPPELPSTPLLEPEPGKVRAGIEESVDQAALLALYERYTGQTTARVERAWIRPRSPLAENSFRCTVRVEQAPDGSVRSTELMDCNGDSHWQESLVFAIERASPLPAPPDPTVFSHQLILSFSASPYVEGVSRQEEYEPVEARLVASP